MTLNHAAGLLAMLALIAIGVCIGYLTWGRQVIAVDERAAAPVWHDDGSVTAMRDPKARTDLPETSAPPGGRLVRTVEVTVRAKPAIIEPQITGDKSGITAHNGANKDSTEGLIGQNSAVCPPVTVRLDMREYRDGPDLGLRVSARAEGGEILDAVDIPRDTIYMPRQTRNAAALVRVGDTTTLTVSRTFGALDVGVAASLTDGANPSFGPAVAYRW